MQTLVVMRGLQPRIYLKSLFKGMDCRVKPGNDVPKGQPPVSINLFALPRHRQDTANTPVRVCCAANMHRSSSIDPLPFRPSLLYLETTDQATGEALQWP